MAWGDEPPRARKRRTRRTVPAGPWHIVGRVIKAIVGWGFGGVVAMVTTIVTVVAFCSGPDTWGFDTPAESLTGRCAFVDPPWTAALALEVDLGDGAQHRYLVRLSCTDRRWTAERDEIGVLDEIEDQTKGATLHLVIMKVPAVVCSHDACRCERKPGRAPKTLSDRIEVDASLFPRHR